MKTGRCYIYSHTYVCTHKLKVGRNTPVSYRKEQFCLVKRLRTCGHVQDGIEDDNETTTSLERG